MTSADKSSPHWYILTYLGTHRDAVKRLEHCELKYFAPVFFAKESAKAIRHDYLLFTSYAFIFGSQNEIYERKQHVLQLFNFLPMKQGSGQQHPFVEEETIYQLKQVEKFNDGKIPYIPYQNDVAEGDTIKILVGQFAGQKATAITKNGSKYRQVVLDFAGKFIIPLCRLKAGEYEIVEYSKGNKNSNTVKAEDVRFLHNALERFYGIAATDDATQADDAARARAIAQSHETEVSGSHTTRVNASILLVMAYTILDDNEKQRHYIDHTINLINSQSTPALSARAYCTLYGCTFNDAYRDFYQSVKQTTRDAKSLKVIATTDKVMDNYRNWYKTLHPQKSSHKLACADSTKCWFAVETPSLSELTEQLTSNGITTFNPDISINESTAVLLVNTTFDTLKGIQTDIRTFTFIRDNINGQDTPLYYKDKEVEDYRHLLTTAADGLQHLKLDSDYKAILEKAHPADIDINGRTVHGFVCEQRYNNRQQKRLILYLRDLAAISVPHLSNDLQGGGKR